MGIRFIRQPSDEPNISNADDARMIRYSYGGYNGFVKGKGAELSATPSGSTFKINSGVVVLHGYETEIDSNGWEITIANTPTKRYFSVWYEVNLATQTVKIDSTYDTADYPSIPASDDLTISSTGTARLLLYQFTATSGVIADVNKKVAEISYTKALIESIVTAITDGTLVAEKAKRDNNGDIIPNTYRRKSERVLFFDGSVSVGNNGAIVTRNVGDKTLVRPCSLEVECSLSGYRFRQTVVLYNDGVTFLQWVLAGEDNILTAYIAYFGYNTSTSLDFGPPNSLAWNISTKTGTKTTPDLTIHKIWVVE